MPLDAALDRILAETVASPRDVPAADNAAVDGYAYAHADYEAAGGFFPGRRRGSRRAIRSPSPHVSRHRRRASSPARVMPAGADTVAMQEDCETHRAGRARFRRDPARTEARRQPPQGRRGPRRRRDVAEPGTRLRPQEIAAIASTGRDRDLRLSAGCASRSSRPATRSCARARRFGPGQVYDSNHFLLAALLRTVGLRDRRTPASCRDDADAVRGALGAPRRRRTTRC